MNWKLIHEYVTEHNKNFLIFVTIFTGYILLILGGVSLDLLLNPWITKAAEEWQWYNYFTSKHALTVLYIKANYFWPVVIITSFIFSLFFSFALYLRRKH